MTNSVLLVTLCCLTWGALSIKGAKFDANRVLEKFGYLDDLAPGQSGHSEVATKDAIREYQRFNGLNATGILDDDTIIQMKKPRCGLPDVIKPSQRTGGRRRGRNPRSARKTRKRGGRKGRRGGNRRGKERSNPNQPVAFYAPGYKWDKRDLTYKVVGYTRQLGGSEQNDAFRNAFQKWANVVPLNFRKVTSGNADIDIFFARRQHSDGPGNAFDGRGGTLAHAFFPGETPIAGDTHFDDDEQWTLNTDEGTNLEIVAAHEFGHALGMGHSNVPSALMAPYYQGYDANYGLHRDDISGIQTLYGRGSGSAGGGRRTTPRPTRPTTTPTPRGPYCNVKFDAIAGNSDGYMYLFRKTRVYKMNSRGIIGKKRITTLFPNAPSSPGAALYDRYRRQLFIFKGSRYWRYTNSRLDAGYPRPLPNDFRNVRAAFQWSDRGLYLFGRDNKYTRWAEGLTRFPRGYPRPVRNFWDRAPTNVEAALQGQDDYYYLFKGRRYWKYNARAQLQRGYPKSTRPAWLSCGRPVPR